ncbi:MAG: hypothetical protein OCU18_05065, partial [Candidatus Syntrophoarchaeum sp.]|nr:hypothetical protein [Candidatus Syntrophoarchaeum sp.]
MYKLNRRLNMIGTSFLTMVLVLSVVMPFSMIPVSAQEPLEGYLVPQDSTGSPGADTLVTLKADITGENVASYQVDIHFDTNVVNITDVDFTDSPFPGNSWQHYGDYVRVGGIDFFSTINAGTHTLCTLTLTGIASGESAIEFTGGSVTDLNGNEVGSIFTNGTFTIPSQDDTPPTTTHAVTPPPNANGWNADEEVSVTFFRSDDDSGVAYTNWSNVSDTGPWTQELGEDPFNVTITTEGITTIWFYSVDNAGNPEDVKNVTVKIASPPEITSYEVSKTEI